MFKITIERPEYLETKEYITPDNLMVAEFLQDKVEDLRKSDASWKITITPTKINYLGECLL
jgi:hypothetical protein